MSMISKNPEGIQPKISATAFVHPSAVIIGNVKIGKNVFIGPFATIRADERASSIVIGDQCNIQDGVIIHALTQTAVKIGKKTSLSHGSLIHGPCTIGDNCFVGFKSIVFKSTVSDNVFIGHDVLIEDGHILENSKVESSSIIRSHHSFHISPIDEASSVFMQKVLEANQYLVDGYRTESNTLTAQELNCA